MIILQDIQTGRAMSALRTGAIELQLLAGGEEDFVLYEDGAQVFYEDGSAVTYEP